MKISNLESSRASEIVAINRPQTVTSIPEAHADKNSSGGDPATKVELSPEGQALAAARRAVDAAPDTRDDLVARIKEQVDNGTYHVSGIDIAEQMIRRAKADKLGQ